MSGAVDTEREAVERTIAMVWKLHGEPADGPDPNAVGLPISILDLVETARALAAERDAALAEAARMREALGPFAEVARWMRDNGHGEKTIDFLVRAIGPGTGPSGCILGHAMVLPEHFQAASAALGGRADG